MKVTTDACLFGAWVAESGVGSQESGVAQILDIGSGTGLLSLMFAQKNKDVVIEAIEIDAETAQQARENLTASPWPERINIIHADVRTYDLGKKYDLVISNPPFYENELSSTDHKKNIAHHSEELLINDLFGIIKKLLQPSGNFALLLPYKRFKELEKQLKKVGLHISEKVLVKQSVNHDFFRVIVLGGLIQVNEISTKEFSIWNTEQQYTREFIELLKDYYLYL